jgi:hypothetical protein
MKITLKIDGKDKTFTAPFISGRTLKETLEFQENLEKSAMASTILDDMVNFLVKLFGSQFTSDQYYDGIDYSKFYSTIGDCINEILGRTNKATEALQDPNA